MKKLAVSLTALLLFATSAHAGYKGNTEVTMLNQLDGSVWVFGNSGAARKSADNFQTIGCRLTGTNSTTVASVQCFANNSAGRQVVCTSNNPSIINTAASAPSHAFWNFTAKNGVCVELQVENYSHWSPLVP